MSPGVVSVSDEVKTESSVAQVEALRATVMELLERNRQLEEALTTRIVIEQAKGILAERLDVDVEEAFSLLRMSARSDRIRLDVLAAQVVREQSMPHAIVRGLSRESRWRAVAMRERSEVIRERARRLRQAVEAPPEPASS